MLMNVTFIDCFGGALGTSVINVAGPDITA